VRGHRAGFAVFLLAAGCSPRVLAVRTTVPVMTRGAASMEEEGDLALAEQAMPSQLKLLDGLLANDPGNASLLTLTSKGYGGYAFLFVEGADEARASALYLRARDFGLRALKRSAACELAAETDPALIDACLARFKRRDAPALFWTAYAWSGAVKLKLDSPESIAEFPKIERMMRRVDALSPGFFYGGPDTFLGSYYGGRSKMLGGDPEKAKRHFDKALAAGGARFLTVQLLYARYYAVQFQDKGLFHDLLTRVAAASPDILPEQRLANTVAIKKAKELLKKEDELFE